MQVHKKVIAKAIMFDEFKQMMIDQSKKSDFGTDHPKFMKYFEYKGNRVVSDNQDSYILFNKNDIVEFTKGDVLVNDADGINIISKAKFDLVYEAA